MSEGQRLVLLSDVALEMLLAAARKNDPTIAAHHIEYGVERRDLVSFFVPVITTVPAPADPAQLPETG